MVRVTVKQTQKVDDITPLFRMPVEIGSVVSRGDLLDMATHAVEYAFIDGRAVALDGLQQRLYEKFKAKYED